MYGFARKRRKGYNQDWGRIWVDYRRLTRDEKNSRIAALTSGCPAFQKHAKHAEGSDTSYVSHTRKALSTERENRNFDRNEKRLRSPAGPRRLGTATRISASLSRRLSVFFVSTPGQGPKAAKLAVLIPGPGMLVNVRNAPRVVIPPPSETPPVSACKPLCAILLAKASVYSLLPTKANVGRLCQRRRSPYDRCIRSVDMTASPALFEPFSRTKKKAG